MKVNRRPGADLAPRSVIFIARREFIKRTALGSLGLITGSRGFAALAQATAGAPTVETTAGTVRGAGVDGNYAFKGIPYGDTTAGSNRFMPPKKPAPWAGVRDALEFGPMAMQEFFTPEKFAQWAESDFGRLAKGMFRWPVGPPSEACLVLNVSTPGLGDGRKRPVMVWLHGGAFSGGFGGGGWAEGTNLARKNDVVVVSINHRLNIFGFLYLGEIGGSKYAESGNAGMLDIVAALEWVRDNIAAFGGDPGNVTVLGQSGGGCKADVLMAMPSAKGLFHRAINMSGPAPKMLTREDATRTATQVMGHLNIRRDQIDLLQQTPADIILKAMDAVLAANGGEGWRGGTLFHMFAPVVDGGVLPRHPFFPTAPELSSDVPLLIGNTADEDRTSVVEMLHSPDGLGTEQMRTRLRKMGIEDPQAVRLIRGYQATRPGASPADVLTAIVSDLEFRMDAITIAERKAAQSRAHVFMYLFTWDSPAFGGVFRSPHSLDVPFAFDDVDAAPGIWGPEPDPRRYSFAENVSRAWVAFARTGNPNHPGMPEWKPYSLKDRATMTLNYSCALVNDPRREDRLVMETLKS
jgi:para-nitrobenzyl esterase